MNNNLSTTGTSYIGQISGSPFYTPNLPKPSPKVTKLYKIKFELQPDLVVYVPQNFLSEATEIYGPILSLELVNEDVFIMV
jgi:hypothetical protein